MFLAFIQEGQQGVAGLFHAQAVQVEFGARAPLAATQVARRVGRASPRTKAVPPSDSRWMTSPPSDTPASARVGVSPSALARRRAGAGAATGLCSTRASRLIGVTDRRLRRSASASSAGLADSAAGLRAAAAAEARASVARWRSASRSFFRRFRSARPTLLLLSLLAFALQPALGIQRGHATVPALVMAWR